MSLLESLRDPAVWELFYSYKEARGCQPYFLQDLRRFIDRQKYLPVCDGIDAGTRFPLPRQKEIPKSNGKQRTVYTYPHDENTVMKLLTWLMTRRYDPLLPEGVYSFRPGVTAKDAVRALARTPGIGEKYAYKADVSDYFNSVPVERLVPLVRQALADDPALSDFLTRLLEEPEVLRGGTPLRVPKGMMAGTPMAAFYANLYLSALDRRFTQAGAIYARYSDDIILFADTPEALETGVGVIRAALAENGLRLNPDKETFYTPETGFTFLGFSYRDGELDVAGASVDKLKKKMRRKTRALLRWAHRKDLPGEKAAKGFVNAFNRKMYEGGADNELTWALWYFPVITTDKSLKALDAYAEECVRYLCSGTRTKARFNVRYEQIKALGFRSLVHEYYAFREQGRQD